MMPPRPTPTLNAQILIRLPLAERLALERAAAADARPVSALARKIITDWLKNRSK